MYNTKILTANNYGSFENLYEDFRKKYLPSKLGQSTKLIVDYIMKNINN